MKGGDRMKVMKRLGVLACIAILGVPMSVLAQQPGPGMKQDHQMGGMQQQGMSGIGMGMMKQDKQDKEMGGMQDCKMMEGMMKPDQQMGDMQQQGMQGMGMMEMCQKMQEGTAQDCKMMDGMKGQHQSMIGMKKHLREMKKHMNMLDEMMDGMMDKMMMQRRQGMTPPGSGSESQEHHPAESK
jgi:hypothetical protein